MQVTPSGKRPFPTPPTPNTPDLESAKFANRDTVVLPNEMVIKILMNLGTTDIAVCRRVNRHWQTLTDTRHLLARSFYRDCHLTQRINSAAVEYNLTVERYRSHIRGWLTDFSDRGRATAKQLDHILKDKYFPEVLFFSIPKLLLNSNELTCQNVATIRHSGSVRDARFSPGGKLLVTVSKDRTFKIWRLEDDQWQEKFTIQHSTSAINTRSATNASFSPDGKHLVTTSDGGICKIWRFEDDQWQEKVTIEYSRWFFTNARFSPDGKHLVISSSARGTVKIWRLDGGEWEEKFIIQHRYRVTNARFSPDGKYLVTITPGDDIHHYNYAKLWELVDNQWQENATILHTGIVDNVHFSHDGKYLVTASRDGAARICGLEGGKWRVKDIIWHFDGPLANANFSRDGKFLVTASCDGAAKICGLVDGKWQEMTSVGHPRWVINASFGPDGYQIVTASSDRTAKVWVLKKKENDDNS